MSRIVFAFLLLVAISAQASGPTAPVGWDGSFEPTLPNGLPCCLSVDLNGSGLIGGAFVLLSSNKKSFGIFALTYTPPLKEHWQLLEKHPISELSDYLVSIEPAGQFPFESIKVCKTNCVIYYANPSIKRDALKRAPYVKR